MGEERELEESCWLLLSCCHTPVPSILTAGWILITFFPLRFYTLLHQYFSHQIIDLLISRVSKIPKDLANFVTTLSLFGNFLSSLSQGCAPKTYQIWVVNSWNVDSWRFHIQFVTRRATDRRGYIKENQDHSTNLDISVFMTLPLEIAKGDYYWCETRHWPYFWIVVCFFFHINQDPP